MTARVPAARRQTLDTAQAGARTRNVDACSGVAAAPRLSAVSASGPHASAHRNLQDLADQSAQVQELAQLRVGLDRVPPPTAVAQLVFDAGIYRTKKKGNLRDTDREVIAEVPSGAQIRIADQARTSTFSLGTWSISKSHTWVRYSGDEGWIRDPAIGARVSDLPVVRPKKSLVAKPTHPPTSSIPIGIGTVSRPIGIGTKSRGVSREPAATTTLEELRTFRSAERERYEAPNPAPNAKPLGLDTKMMLKVEPKDFLVRVGDGLLMDRDMESAITVTKSPFVLNTDGTLYGGQGKGFATYSMNSHNYAGVAAPAWAGELEVDGGKVVAINNQSGTFMLSDKANINIIKFLFRHGVLNEDDLGDLNVERVYKPGIDRDGLLERHRYLWG